MLLILKTPLHTHPTSRMKFSLVNLCTIPGDGEKSARMGITIYLHRCRMMYIYMLSTCHSVPPEQVKLQEYVLKKRVEKAQRDPPLEDGN